MGSVPACPPCRAAAAMGRAITCSRRTPCAVTTHIKPAESSTLMPSHRFIGPLAGVDSPGRCATVLRLTIVRRSLAQNPISRPTHQPSKGRWPMKYWSASRTAT